MLQAALAWPLFVNLPGGCLEKGPASNAAVAAQWC